MIGLAKLALQRMPRDLQADLPAVSLASGFQLWLRVWQHPRQWSSAIHGCKAGRQLALINHPGFLGIQRQIIHEYM